MAMLNSRVSSNLSDAIKINENFVGYSDGAYDKDNLMKKWHKEVRTITEATKGKVDDHKVYTTAVLLENTTRALESAARRKMTLMESGTQPADVSFFKKFAVNLLSAIIPNLIAEDIVSVQPMLSRSGEVRYMQVLYGSNKAPVKKGQMMYSNFTGGDFSQNQYTSAQISGEAYVGDGSTTKYALGWVPVVPKTVNGSVNGTTFTDDGNGNLTGVAGTIDYANGTLSFGAAPAMDDAISVDYTYDNISAPVDVGDITIRYTPLTITAESRKIKCSYAFDALYDSVNDFGQSLSSEAMIFAASQLKFEIDQEIINELYNRASSPGIIWNRTPRTGVSIDDHNHEFLYKLIELGNTMYFNTRVASPNFYVLGELASTVVESLDRRYRSAGATNPHGPYLAGYLDEKPVYKSPSLPSTGFLSGYKGQTLFESGYIYAPYMPVMMTQLLTTANFEASQGYTTSYGKKMVQPEFYSASQIVTAADVVNTHTV